MDFRRPLAVVTPTLDGDALAVLAGADAALSARQVHRLVGHSSEEGVRRALRRLTGQGVVHVQQAGAAHMYRLNRQHLAAPYVEGLAGLRFELITRLRALLAEWTVPAEAASLFGSVARGRAGSGSDLDLLIVRPPDVDTESDVWRHQLDEVARLTSAWTGNDTRVLECGHDDLRGHAQVDAVVRVAADEGIALVGDLRYLRLPDPHPRRGT